MDFRKLCAANSLETLELVNIKFWVEDAETFVKVAKFLFRIPNKETGIHHFSRLKCLKLWIDEVERVGWQEDLDKAEGYNLYKDKERTKIAFPMLETSMKMH